MAELLQVVLLALMPAAGAFAGGLVAEFTPTSRRRLSLALHLSAGIIFGVIAIELAPRAFGGGAPVWLAGLGFLAGGGFYLVLDEVTSRLHRRSDGAPKRAAGGGWLVYAAVATDLLSDGLLVGVGSSLSFGLALVLAIGQVTANAPEGYAAVANFKDKKMPRRRRLLASASFALPAVGGALIAWFLLRQAPEAVRLTALAFTAGLLLLAASEEVINEAHETIPDHRLGAFMIAAGFVLFALVSAYFSAG